MNWTASLLRNELKNEKLAHQEKAKLLESQWNQEKQELETKLQQNKEDYETKLTNLTQENNLSQQLVQELTRNCQKLTTEQEKKERTNQALTILANQRKQDLEREKQALVNLAKQKIKGKKEASELLNQLEISWQQNRENWEEERIELIAEFTKQHQEALEEKDTEIRNLEDQLTQNEEKHYQQLKDIALLFRENIDNITDFNNLYELLKQVAERKNEYDKFLSEKNRESKKGDKWWWQK